MENTESYRKPIIHFLKTWPRYFKDLASGVKTFEVRVNDRDFRVGDILCHREYDPTVSEYTGRELRRLVTYIYGGECGGLEDGYVVLGVSGLDFPMFASNQ